MFRLPLDGLYITPFDCRGRDLLYSLIENAKEWVYVSTESFTDEDFSQFLVDFAINRGIAIKILTGASSEILPTEWKICLGTC